MWNPASRLPVKSSFYPIKVNSGLNRKDLFEIILSFVMSHFLQEMAPINEFKLEQ